jgi:hypothetical protein
MDARRILGHESLRLAVVRRVDGPFRERLQT